MGKMAQICKLKTGRKYPDTKNGRIMVRDPRQKINSDNFTINEKKISSHKLFKINSSKNNQQKVVSLEDRGVKARKLKRSMASNNDSLETKE